MEENEMSKQRNVAVLLFDDVEVLDFAGPFEVFSVTGKRDGSDPFTVYTVAEKPIIQARNNLTITPTYNLQNCPRPDILVLPGGGGKRPDGTLFGTRKEKTNQVVLEWLQRQSKNTEIILSVCTGALLLAKAGLMDGLRATTHHRALDELRSDAPTATIVSNERIIDNETIIFSGGISAGIDAAFHVVEKLLGTDVAKETASYMEYNWGGASWQ
jgi:transcriptional regulator GlxA family with amidase domain